MEAVPETDFLFNAPGKVNFDVLAIDKDFCVPVAHAGVRDSKFPFQRKRDHACRGPASFSFPDVFSRHIDFHAVSPLVAGLNPA